MGLHPFRVAPPESFGGAHCVGCGRQLPRAELGLDVDGNVICAECRPEALPGTTASDAAESMTKRLVFALLALAMLAWVMSRVR